MIQEERSIFWEVVVLIIVKRKVRIDMFLGLNVYRHTAVCMFTDIQLFESTNTKAL